MLVGCCSKAAKSTSDASIEQPRLADWFASPIRYRGRQVAVGGRVLALESNSIELLAYPGNACGEADFGEFPVGRVLVKSPIALLAERFPPGREVTVLGRITGARAVELGDTRRELPVLEAAELITPAPPIFFPMLRFGFGFSGGF